MEKMVVRPRLTTRSVDDAALLRLTASGTHPLLARLWAARGVVQVEDIKRTWSTMLPPASLTQAEAAACHLADAIENQRRLLVVADYDCDGATACAVALRALRSMGARVDFLVPNRFETGYGLSPEVVQLAVNHAAGRPDMLITVDNGIASVDGVAAARAQGIEVIVTDHHLPGDVLPDALAIVNPNHPHCGFPSKHLAGVGVIFYLMLALRAEMRKRGHFSANNTPRLDKLADLVALGTVADVVKLDSNNRLLVAQGIKAMRSGQMQAGVRALLAVAGREPRQVGASDLGFILGPRINAAGRLADMSVGIHCLTSDDDSVALELARELDAMNRQRRTIEGTMREQAMAAVENAQTAAAPSRVEKSGQASLCVYQPDWHQGIVGIVASRLKETWWRPTLVFSRVEAGLLRGSGRSIPELHLRDALDLVAKQHPGMILKFGGHAMAAGLTLDESRYEEFTHSFDAAVRKLTGRSRFEPVIETDGSLESGYANVQVAQMLASEVWGAGFPAPVFLDEFRVVNQRLLKDKHLKLLLERSGQRFEAIWFNHADVLPEFVQAAYRLDVNAWKGSLSVQLLVEHADGL